MVEVMRNGIYHPAPQGIDEYNYIVTVGQGPTFRILCGETSLIHAKSSADLFAYRGMNTRIFKLVGEVTQR